MLKKSLILFLFISNSLSAYAEQKVSGYDFLNNPLTFETSDIVSYGRIVIGKANSNSFSDNKSKKFNFLRKENLSTKKKRRK